MNIRPAISVPLPWMTSLIGKAFGRAGQKAASGKKSFFKLPRSLKITREGKWFIGILFIIGLAAINTGNNLLYLVVATLLSLIVISGVMSEATLRGIKVKRTLPPRVFKNTPVPVRISVHNVKRLLPSFSFIVSEALVAPGLEASPAYALKLRAGESEMKKPEYMFKRRGRITLCGVKVATRFPFGLFLKGKEEEDRAEVLVYPAVGRPQKKYLAGEKGPFEGSPAFKKGGGRELHNLRDYTPRDDSRFIYWKSAAKTSRLLLKEFERESEKRVFIVFENRSPDKRRGDEGSALFEEAVDEAASLAGYFLEKGCSVGLKTVTGIIPDAAGKAQMRRLLEALALIGPAGEGSPSVTVEYL